MRTFQRNPLRFLAVLALLGSLHVSWAAGAQEFSKPPMSGTLKGRILLLKNEVIETRWGLGAGVVGPMDSGLWKRAGFCPVKVPEGEGWTWKADFSGDQELPVEKPAMVVRLHGTNGKDEAHYRFRIFAGVPAVEWRREAKPGQAVEGDSTLRSLEAMAEDPPGISSVHLQDHTDRHGKKDNLVKATAHNLVGGAFEVAANIGLTGNCF